MGPIEPVEETPQDGQREGEDAETAREQRPDVGPASRSSPGDQQGDRAEDLHGGDRGQEGASANLLRQRVEQDRVDQVDEADAQHEGDQALDQPVTRPRPERAPRRHEDLGDPGERERRRDDEDPPEGAPDGRGQAGREDDGQKGSPWQRLVRNRMKGIAEPPGGRHRTRPGYRATRAEVSGFPTNKS
jgi:hypothetical protein